MTNEVEQRIKDVNKIMDKIFFDGYDKHASLYEEALEYYLLDVLQESDWERLKKEFKV